MQGDAEVYYWQDAERLVLFAAGRVTAAEAYSIHQQVAAWLERHPGSTVIVDLDQTEYMDSTTIGTLVRLHKLQQSGGAAFALTNPSQAAARTLEDMRLTRFFTVLEEPQLRSLEREAFHRVPRRPRGEMSSEFVLDAHHDLCGANPDLRPKFAKLIEVLSTQVSPR